MPTKIGRVRLDYSITQDNFVLVPIPKHILQALNKSTAVAYGTSFDHNRDVTIWLNGGTAFGGTASLIMIGTGLI